MKRRWVIGPTALPLVVLLALAFRPPSEEPEYQGKKLSEWLSRDTDHIDTVRAIGRIGTNGLPYLIHAVAYEPLSWRRYLPEVAYRLHLVSDDKDRAADDALRGFMILGQVAEPAVPKLGRILRSTRSCTCAVRVCKVLINIGDGGIDEVVAAVEGPGTRKKACIIYYGMTEARWRSWDTRRDWDMRRAVPALLRAMENPDYGPFARKRLVEASTENWMALAPVLAACLRHTNESMRVSAAIVVNLNPNVTASVKLEAEGILKEAPPELVRRLAAN